MVEQNKLRSFLKIECELGEIAELEWKHGPYMAYVKIGGIAITYWQNKGALMLQGPTENTQRMNKRLVEHLWKGIGGLPPTQSSTALDTGNEIAERGNEIIKEMRRTQSAETKQDTTTSSQIQEITHVDVQELIAYSEGWTPDTKKREEAEYGQGDKATPRNATSRETPHNGENDTYKTANEGAEGDEGIQRRHYHINQQSSTGGTKRRPNKHEINSDEE